MDMISL